MANEITITCNLSFAKEGISDSLDIGSLLVNVAGTKITHLVQSIGTVEEAINFGDISAAGGYAMFINRGTSVINLRPAVAGANFATLNEGDVALMRLGTNTTQAIATGSASDLEFLLIEA